ncbi:MAG: sulfite exporter TauE/SafE family protein [Candidatus Zixiibacteriota bacterium]
MTSDINLTLLLAGAFLSAVISAVCGFGGGILYLPLMVAIVGPRSAVPLMAFGLMISNFTRFWLLRRHCVWPLTWRYTAGAVPGALIGALVFVQIPTQLITTLIGVFLIVSVVISRWQSHRPLLTRWTIFYPLGAVVGFFSSIFGVVGPASIPFFLATGLHKEAFVSTVAFGAFVMHLTAVAAFSQFRLLNGPLLQTGVFIGLAMIGGTWIGKQILMRAQPTTFLFAVDVLLVGLGVFFLVR